MEEITVSVELEHAFGENPAASDGERYAASPTAKDNVKLTDVLLWVIDYHGR
jgi:hypothetical protein